MKIGALSWVRNKNISEIIGSYAILFFLLRTIFPIYKFVFLAFLFLLIITQLFNFHKPSGVLIYFKALWAPFLIFVLFLINFSSNTILIKELINTVLVFYLLLSKPTIITNEKLRDRLEFNFIVFVGIAGIVALLRSAMGFFEYKIPFSSILFSSNIFSLVTDSNFYALFFLLQLIVLIFHFNRGKIRIGFYMFMSVISILNILGSLSRRAYLAYALFFIIVLFYAFWQKRLAYFLHLILVAVLFGLIALWIYNMDYRLYSAILKNRSNVLLLYKVKTLNDENMTLDEFEYNLKRNLNNQYWRKKAGNDPKNNNLFYNGDLSEGLLFWDNLQGPDDRLNIQLLKDYQGNFIRIERTAGTGYWQVYYQGRPIYYHEGYDYTLTFKYRVIKGAEIPFKVGWWTKERGAYIYDLEKQILSYDSAWRICTVVHKFEKKQINPACFLNHLESSSIIDIKDIQLTCNDCKGDLPMFVDQVQDSVINNAIKYKADTVNNLMLTRFDRWGFAMEIWNTKYTWYNKVFGKGFGYLNWYGEKFYKDPQRLDYPHNPIISSFLYSGIIGGLFYIYFLILVFWNYWKFRKSHIMLFLIYILTFFFCMFSGNSHFSVPLLTFLSFVPFLPKIYDESKHSHSLL